MLVSDLYAIGNKLLFFRKIKNLTQAQVAEIAGISDRTYADIERGTANMRIETFVRICEALDITPDSVLIENSNRSSYSKNLLDKLSTLSPQNQKTVFALLSVYIDSLE